MERFALGYGWSAQRPISNPPLPEDRVATLQKGTSYASLTTTYGQKLVSVLRKINSEMIPWVILSLHLCMVDCSGLDSKPVFTGAGWFCCLIANVRCAWTIWYLLMQRDSRFPPSPSSTSFMEHLCRNSCSDHTTFMRWFLLYLCIRCNKVILSVLRHRVRERRIPLLSEEEDFVSLHELLLSAQFLPIISHTPNSNWHGNARSGLHWG